MTPEIITALDFKYADGALTFLDKFEESLFVKVGMELFYADGPDVIKRIKDRGHRVFLDLKLHDIPNTVEHAMRNIAALGIDMTNVHAAGGIRMMEAALRGLTDGAADQGLDDRPILIAVTQLTSTSQEMLNGELLIDGSMDEVVGAYAINAHRAGLDGVVCSAWESGRIHQLVSREFIAVTPGIRLAGDDANDQRRIATPAVAAEMGSDYLVIGRSITAADDPVSAYHRCIDEINDHGYDSQV